MDIPVYRVCIGFVICPLQCFFITKKSPFENARNDGLLHLFLVMFIQGGPPYDCSLSRGKSPKLPIYKDIFKGLITPFITSGSGPTLYGGT